MNVKAKYRIGAVLSAAAISTMGLGLAGVTTAGAAPGSATAGTTGTHAGVRPAAAASGTYELFYNSGSGFVDDGQLYLNSNGSWSLQNYVDGGTWATVGQTIGMSDLSAGYTNDAAWGAKTSGTSLGSAAKPGRFLAADVASATWYATFTSSSIPAHARPNVPLVTAGGVRPQAGATFPGTYNIFAPAGEIPTAFNSDGTWSMTSSGFCDNGSYLSFKEKLGTKIIYTVILADQGCSEDQLWMAKEHGTSKLGTALKPGIIATEPSGTFASWYATLG